MNMFLFVSGSIDQHRFKDDFTAENLKNFIKNKSGIQRFLIIYYKNIKIKFSFEKNDEMVCFIRK